MLVTGGRLVEERQPPAAEGLVGCLVVPKLAKLASFGSLYPGVWADCSAAWVSFSWPETGPVLLQSYCLVWERENAGPF
jgi:hypothetical protein